ncbi:hypothetical protein LB542_19805 [Mesorhizobium sp. BR1-1-9]|uniref:hypothetical protein n=1 Tax=Mesorhizobium sp. BR1-1-9 TaxID=2876646 RepID=UPI001CD0C88B|nr:hypothetical protein [Mesorhizobium sp. BR1-1-9]MBZ9873096.1 hypothetical protein [Mesorhizobium sp. BR1-1-9]
MKADRKPMLPGYDGTIEIETAVRMTATRSEPRILRCRPGTFSWRYGRKSADASLYHAGVRFAELWEIAGVADNRSPSFEQKIAGQWKSIPDARLEAMDKIEAARSDIGKWGTARLVDYCVMGTSAADIATKYGSDERAMAHVLYEDLRACAAHFEFV